MAPLHAKVSEYILDKIHSGEWPVGHMLPTEMELCRQFDLSRQSVRTAMLSLVNDGYLYRVKGKGTFVTTPHRVEDSTVFIESFAEELHQRGIETETEVLEFRKMAADEHVLHELNLKENSSVIKLSRLRYCKDSFETGAIVLTTSYFTMKLDYLQDYDFSKYTVHRAMNEHNMARAYTEKHIGVSVLDARSARLLGVKEGTLALSVSSCTQDKDGDLIEYCESCYPADRNEFILKIRL